MANDKRDETFEERMLRFQEEQLAFQKEQLRVQSEQAKSQLIVSEATANRLKPKSLEVSEIPQISAFNPRGERTYPMPRLKCEILAPWSIDPQHHGCTREEVELFNLLEPGTYPIELNDGTAAKMDVIARINPATGVMEQLQLQPVPAWNNENRQKFKAMNVMLREMLGEKAAHVLTMKQEKARIALPESDPQHLPVSVSA